MISEWFLGVLFLEWFLEWSDFGMILWSDFGVLSVTLQAALLGARYSL